MTIKWRQKYKNRKCMQQQQQQHQALEGIGKGVIQSTTTPAQQQDATLGKATTITTPVSPLIKTLSHNNDSNFRCCTTNDTKPTTAMSSLETRMTTRTMMRMMTTMTTMTTTTTTMTMATTEMNSPMQSTATAISNKDQEQILYQGFNSNHKNTTQDLDTYAVFHDSHIRERDVKSIEQTHWQHELHHNTRIPLRQCQTSCYHNSSSSSSNSSSNNSKTSTIPENAITIKWRHTTQDDKEQQLRQQSNNATNTADKNIGNMNTNNSNSNDGSGGNSSNSTINWSLLPLQCHNDQVEENEQTKTAATMAIIQKLQPPPPPPSTPTTTTMKTTIDTLLACLHHTATTMAAKVVGGGSVAKRPTSAKTHLHQLQHYQQDQHQHHHHHHHHQHKTQWLSSDSEEKAMPLTRSTTYNAATTIMSHRQLPSIFITLMCLFAFATVAATSIVTATDKTLASASISLSGSGVSLSSSAAAAAAEAAVTAAILYTSSNSSGVVNNNNNNNHTMQFQQEPIVAAVLSSQSSASSASASSSSSSASSMGTLHDSQTAKSLPMLASTIPQCSLSEYSCSNGRCVPLSKYCNNINDCGDGSDEPRFCTRCNRTYYGDIGLTYSLELHRPKQDRLPYICQLTFTAAGGQHGDVVQVTLDSFTIGRFTSYTQDGCPDGYMQIAESARTPIGGMWCGTSWGPVLFYSESRSLIFTIKLNKLARDQSGYNFDFRIRYKVLSRESSVTRYGGIKVEELQQWHNRSSFLQPSNTDDFTNSSGAHSDRYAQDFSLFSAYANNKTFMNSLSKEMERDEHNYTEPKYYLGDLIPGTYCSRIFSDCDKKSCRLQSPNYPGIYPRNLTCYFAVRQHDVPHGKHALILVKQPKGNLVWISTQDTSATKSSPSNNEKDKKFEPRLKTWSDCDNIQDYVTVYDGYTTRDPIILKFCGGGQAVPAAVSSGPELLVEFTTSPYGTFTGSSSQVLPLYGFQLEVEVIFVDIQSPTYSKNKKPCEFWIRGSGRGILENPKHSLAPNTTCLYHLQGVGIFKTFDHLSLSRRTNAQGLHSPPSRFKVWISMLKFNLDPDYGQIDETSVGAIGVLQTQEDCSGMLRIWDGSMREPPVCKDLNCMTETNPVHPSLQQYAHNTTNVIARYCRGTIPRTCDRANINETYARPCTVSESYVSSGDSITLELKNTETTVLRPLEFKLKYEFIDLHQDGLPMGGGELDCNRKFVSNLMDRKDPAIFRSVRNIFLFGRGGTRNLKCIYKFEGMRGERVRIKLRKVTTMNRHCMSRVDEDINRSFCYGDTSVKVEIFERPYHDTILLPRGCLCNSSNSSHLPVEYTSTSRDVEVHFTAYNMTTLDDPDALNFEGMFEFVKGPTNCKDGRRKFGPSGTIDMTFGDMDCRSRPWLIEPSNGNKFLYVRLKAIFLRKYNPKKALNTSVAVTSSYRCETKSRAVLTTAEGLTITACPLAPDSKAYEFVEIFSAGWNERPNFAIANRSKAISVEFLRPENGDFSFNWMELIPGPTISIAEDCQYKCTRLNACVNASVWCDGVQHCPSGDDETFLQCSAIMKLPIEILATLCLIIVLFCCAFAAFAYKKIKRKLRGSSVLQTRLKSLSSMDTAVLDEKEVIC